MEFEYDKILHMVNKLAQSINRKHREEVVSDTLLLVYENEASFMTDKKVKQFVRKLFNEAKRKHFNKYRENEISIGGIEDIEQIENDGGYVL